MYNYNQNYSSPTSLGIQERWERVLAYALIWVSGLILLFVEQRNQTVRRHAMQSVIIFGSLVGFVTFGLWILLMVLAYFNANTIFVGPRHTRYL